MLRYLTAGESHGRALVVIVEGLPAGLLVTAGDIQHGLSRRRLGFGRGPRMRFEVDEVTLVGGIRHGRTLGSPVAIEIANTEWPKWETEMSACPGRGWVSIFDGSPGLADISVSHLGHSVLAISMATGDPRVRPWRMPPTRVTSSTSNRILGPRPNPRRRRERPCWMSPAVTSRPAGRPSTITTRARPWDSPAVR